MTRQSCEVGILFCDIAGSTRLYETFGDGAALAAINTCLRLMADATISHQGVVVKTIGDELMAVFYDAPAMASAAVAIQRRIDALAPVTGPGGESRLCIRAGFHFGPAIEENADFYGDTVNVAARLVGLAKACQIITTAETAALLTSAQRSTARELGSVPVKGKAEEVRVVEVMWREESGKTTTLDLRPERPRPEGNRLRLRHDQGEWVFDSRQHSIALGREAGNDVVVPDHHASRQHATIERRRDKWVLVDHSTNGTFVTFSGERELRVHREEVILHRPGVISFGQSASNAGFGCIRFSLL